MPFQASRRPGRAARRRGRARRGARRRLLAAGGRDRQAPARGPHARARASGRALHRSERGQRLARDRAAGVPAHAARELARESQERRHQRPFADREHPPSRGARGDPHRAARRQGRRLGAALRPAHAVRELQPDVPHVDGACQRGEAVRRDRSGRDRRPHGQGAARLDGAAGGVDDGARVQGLVRAQAQRHASLARVLRGLPGRAGGLAADLDAAHARPRRAPVVLRLALVLRAGPRVLGGAAAVPADDLPDRAPGLDRVARTTARGEHGPPAALGAGGARRVPDRVPAGAERLRCDRHRRGLRGHRREPTG